MIRIRQSITVNRPVDEVFRFMTDAGNLFKWSRGTEEVRQLTPDPLGVGSRYEITSRFLGRLVPTTLEVIEYIPNVITRSISLDGPFKIESSTTYTSEGVNTKITSESRIEPTGFWKLLEPILPALIRSRSAKENEALRGLLEESMHRSDPHMEVVNLSKTMVVLEH